MLLFIGPLGTTEIIFIVLIILLLFGGKKIPELMRGLGKGIREFNDAKSNVKKEIEDGLSENENMNKTTSAQNSQTTHTSTQQ